MKHVRPQTQHTLAAMRWTIKLVITNGHKMIGCHGSERGEGRRGKGGNGNCNSTCLWHRGEKRQFAQMDGWMQKVKVEVKVKLHEEATCSQRHTALLYLSSPHHHHQLTVQLNGLWCAIDQSINLIIYCVLSYSQSDTSHNHWQTLVDTETCC